MTTQRWKIPYGELQRENWWWPMVAPPLPAEPRTERNSVMFGTHYLRYMLKYEED